MPKNKVKTEAVSKDMIMKVLKAKGKSIRELGDCQEVSSSDKTIRRQLNNGRMRPDLLNDIAKYLDIDVMILKASTSRQLYAHQELSKQFLQKHPYFNGERRAIIQEGMKETLKRILPLFRISYDQFESLEDKTKYEFQLQLLQSTLDVINDYFEKDAFGNTNKNERYELIAELEYSYEEKELFKYADTILRKKYLDNTPNGYTKKDIKRMSPDDLVDLDIMLKWEETTDRFGETV